MRVGIIDLGTNSLRLDVYELGTDRVSRLHREKVMTRLGQGVFTDGRLHPQAVERALKVLRRFRLVCSELHAERVIAVGTSALREAADAALLLDPAKQELEFSIRVVSGKEEAELILKGLLPLQPTPSTPFSFIDIGGGSSELGVWQPGQPPYVESLLIGAARLNQRFLSDGRTAESLRVMRQYIKDTLAAAELPSFPDTALGSSGTVGAIAALLSPEAAITLVERSALAALIEQIALLSPEELLEVPGMNPNRIDIIVPGCIILEEVMIWFRVQQLQYTDRDLRDGILAEFLEQLEPERLAG